MTGLLTQLWLDEEGQDVAEYAVMLGVILAMVVGILQLIGSHAGDVFSRVASSIN
jgi:Flp pilus assembly pilin Flp